MFFPSLIDITVFCIIQTIMKITYFTVLQLFLFLWFPQNFHHLTLDYCKVYSRLIRDGFSLGIYFSGGNFKRFE